MLYITSAWFRYLARKKAALDRGIYTLIYGGYQLEIYRCLKGTGRNGDGGLVGGFYIIDTNHSDIQVLLKRRAEIGGCFEVKRCTYILTTCMVRYINHCDQGGFRLPNLSADCFITNMLIVLLFVFEVPNGDIRRLKKRRELD